MTASRMECPPLGLSRQLFPAGPQILSACNRLRVPSAACGLVDVVGPFHLAESSCSPTYSAINRVPDLQARPLGLVLKDGARASSSCRLSFQATRRASRGSHPFRPAARDPTMSEADAALPALPRATPGSRTHRGSFFS